LGFPQLHAHPEFINLLRTALGSLFENLCVGGNWTAKYAAVKHALVKTREELAPLNITLEELSSLSSGLTPEVVRERFNIPPAWLLPFSTWKDAAKLGRLDELRQLQALA
jgi:hypothetical protein